MPRPAVPRPKDIIDLLKMARAEGFGSVRIETTSEGKFAISVGEAEGISTVTPLEKWRALRGDA